MDEPAPEHAIAEESSGVADRGTGQRPSDPPGEPPLDPAGELSDSDLCGFPDDEQRAVTNCSEGNAEKGGFRAALVVLADQLCLCALVAKERTPTARVMAPRARCVRLRRVGPT